MMDSKYCARCSFYIEKEKLAYEAEIRTMQDRLTVAESEITNQALEAASQARRALSAESERDQLRVQLEAANNPIGFISQEEMKHLLNGATGKVLPCNFKPLGYLSVYAAPILQQTTPAESVQNSVTSLAKCRSDFEIMALGNGYEIARDSKNSGYSDRKTAELFGTYADGWGSGAAYSRSVEQVSGGGELVSQHVTENDAREISSHFVQWLNDFDDQRNATISKWLDDEGRDLLDKLNRDKPSPNKADVPSEQISISAIEKVIALCLDDKEIANVVGVLDMVWTRDKEGAILNFESSEFNKIAKAVTGVRAMQAYKLVWNEFSEEYDALPVESEEKPRVSPDPDWYVVDRTDCDPKVFKRKDDAMGFALSSRSVIVAKETKVIPVYQCAQLEANNISE